MPSRLKLPEAFNAADYYIDRNVREGRGDKIAVLCEDRSFTYRQIQTGVNRFGNALKELDVRMEERVALLLLDTEVYPQAFYGAIKIGAVPVCLNTLNRSQDFEYYLNDCRARVLVVDKLLLEQIEPIRNNLQFLTHIIVANGDAPAGTMNLTDLASALSSDLAAAPTCSDDCCFWLYSSGSTGSPKGTVYLQHNMLYSTETYAKKVLDLREEDVCFSAAKLFFGYGNGNCLHGVFAVGATVVYLPQRPTAENIYKTVLRHRPTVFFGVPTLYGQLLEAEGAMEGVRLCVSAGEALPVAHLHRWKERFNLDILDGIGSTEMGHIFISNRPDDIRPGSSGKVVPGYEVRIVDEALNDLPDGEVGTLLAKGNSSAAYYWNRREKTRQTMMGHWLNTGDKYYRDAEGYYFCAGRSDDMLKVGGIWVSPTEVESCLIEHPEVLECAVIGAPDEENLIKPMAFVVLNKAADSTEAMENRLKEFVKSRLALYKYPRWVRFVDELPKTATGKIRRFELRNLVAGSGA